MIALRLSGLFGLLALHALAQDTSLLDGSRFCDVTCKATAVNASTWERSQHAHEPLDSFYDTPAEFGQSTRPGDVLRIEHHTNLTKYTIPSGLTMSRILYASQDLNGTTVLASGFILWPYEIFNYTSIPHPNQSYPAVAWAHGTSGIHPRCAPSNYRALQYHFITAFPIALEGFAVIAPDYAGLGASARPDGSKHPHQYLAAPAHANDLAFMIEAARKAFPNRLSNNGPFVAAGHSQGGITSWAFANRQAITPVSGYRGTITFSPAEDNISALKQLTPAAVAGLPVPASALSFLPLLSAAITAVYPSFNNTALSPRLFDMLTNVIKPLDLCLPSTLMLTQSPIDEYLHNPEWVNRTEVAEWQQRTAVSRKKFAGPLSVILGGADIVPAASVVASVEETCALADNRGQHLEYLELGAMVSFLIDRLLFLILANMKCRATLASSLRVAIVGCSGSRTESQTNHWTSSAASRLLYLASIPITHLTLEHSRQIGWSLMCPKRRNGSSPSDRVSHEQLQQGSVLRLLEASGE
jgi:pimeloyl-ACP methyl ester carboxylesterase